MSGLVAVLCVILCCCGIPAYCDYNYDPIQIATAYTEKFREASRLLNASGEATVNEDSVQTVGIDFHCDLPDVDPPTSIHDLSPKYVDAVAAMGDSVTAGFGAAAKTIVDDLLEYRGLSWSIGGYKSLKEVATFANLIRKYNPDVTGYSTGTKIPVLTKKVKFNVAVSGARTRDMRGQAEVLVDQFRKEFGDEVDEKWKVITIWIGGNDVCAIKTDNDMEELPTEYVDNMRSALDYLKDNVKRAFVNIVLLIDVSDLFQVKGWVCNLVHRLACSSILSDDTRSMVEKGCIDYNAKLEKLVDNGARYETDDFTVMLQPFFSETQIPRKSNGDADKSYFAPDCFHFSQKGHAAGATFLWNNIFEPVGQKTTHIDWMEEFRPDCPKDYPYFATYKNSQARLSGNLLTSNSDEDNQGTSLVAILVGTGVGVVIVALATVAVAVVVTKLRRRKNESQEPTEKMQLIFYKN